jgi:pyrimidine operon attenuation protein/uracil phosphoribosyltransferase
MPDAGVVVLDADKIGRTITRIAHEIVERNRDLDSLALVGIRSRGVPLAHRLQKRIETISGRTLPVGTLDITLYRDDLTTVGPQAILKETRIPFSIDGRRIVLVDDVLFPVHREDDSCRARRADGFWPATPDSAGRSRGSGASRVADTR